MSDDARHIAIFRQKEIRKQLYHGEWWFVIHDVVGVLTDSVDPAQYLRNIRNRVKELARLFNPVEKGVVQIEPPLPSCLIHGAVSKNCFHGIRKVFSASFNLFLARKPSLLNAGWRASGMSEYRRSRTQNWRKSV